MWANNGDVMAWRETWWGDSTQRGRGCVSSLGLPLGCVKLFLASGVDGLNPRVSGQNGPSTEGIVLHLVGCGVGWGGGAIRVSFHGRD